MARPLDRPVLTKKHLDRQIERIADETPTERVSVIVQMQSADDLTSYLEGSSDAIRQRLSVVSARALVPPSRDSINTDAKGKITPASKRKLQSSSSSASKTFLASAAMKFLEDQE